MKLKSKKARKVNVNFIRKKLIPFILREQGRGFSMETWKDHIPSDLMNGQICSTYDGIKRRYPKCGTVACIGGSVQTLIGLYNDDDINQALGLTKERADNLFYSWRPCEGGWPMKYAQQYEKAKTAITKAKVACRLLEEVCRTDGRCLDGGNGDE